MRGTRLGQGLLRQPSGLLATTSTPSVPALSTVARVPLIRASSASPIEAHRTSVSLPSIRAFTISSPRPKKRNAKSVANEAQEEDPNNMTPKKGWRAKKAREATAFAAGTAPSKSSKGGGGLAAEAAEDEDPDDADPNAPKHPRANPDNPLEFPDVESRFARAHERYNGLLRKLRSGQTSIAVDDIGAVRVKPDPKGQPGVTYPLRELAVVVPKGGRLVSILCHEASYVKPILSGVQNSEMFNQQPQRNPDNELELTMKVVREPREETAKRIREGAHAYREVVRKARGRREKQHVTWVRSGEWGVDLRFRADKELEKKVAKKNLEIDKLEQQALKALASQPDD